ncbi:armadillo-type protein [Limtongia smithiae]|uniref:armadillo-type protein n=1 Tax=Limtongia smithiae TaxID=1125753 RepID=UPI0034CDBC5A
MLENSVKMHYANYDVARRTAIRSWIIELACGVRVQDPFYFREKLALLWVSVAKRTWGPPPADWPSMDADLVRLWDDAPTTRELTLIIFRTLFEDVFMLDDPVAGKRSAVLNGLCVEVLTDQAILDHVYDTRDHEIVNLRCGSEGWLRRWSALLGECLNRGAQDAESEAFAIKILQTLKTCLGWIQPHAIREAALLERISTSLTIPNTKVRTLATDCLHILFTRSFSDPDDFASVVGAVFLPQGIATLASVYASIQMDLDDFDEDQYVLLKKLVEMIVGLGDYLLATKKNNQLPTETDFNGYLELVLLTTRHESLIISGLSLQFWSSILRLENLAQRPAVTELLPRLLELSADRIIKYEGVEERTVTKQFLEMDFESVPEMHAFLGNYKRYIEDIARLVVCRMPIDSMLWLDVRLDKFFSSWHGWHNQEWTTPAALRKDPLYIVAYGQFAIVDAALRGISRWRVWYKEADKEDATLKMNPIIERFCERMLSMEITDPVLLRKQIQTLVQFAPLMKHVPQSIFNVLEKVLHACTFEYPAEATDEDRELIREVRNNCDTELNRLAYLMPEALMEIYPALERIIHSIISSDKVSDHEVVSFLSFLLVISQRSNAPNKAECFAQIVDPVLNRWTDESTVKGLSELPWFMEQVGIVEIANYFRERGVTANTDLLNTPMDDRGRDLKARLRTQWAKMFPIRATRIFIQYTIEKLSHDSEEFQALLVLWKPRVQPIIEYILRLIAQIHAYCNSLNWKDLPEEVRSFVRDSCEEKFWHAGISLQSHDQFVEESVKATQSLRDFANSLGMMLRYTREYAFLALGSITQLEETMYEVPGIGMLLWQFVAGEPQGISLHAWKHLVALVVRPSVKNCPEKLRAKFFVEFLPGVFNQLDALLMERWSAQASRNAVSGAPNGGDRIDELNDAAEGDEALSEEMAEEYHLRQLTNVVDRLMLDLAGPNAGGQSTGKDESWEAGSGQEKKTGNEMRALLIDSPTLLAPFLSLCNHLLTVRDTRCSYSCAMMLRQMLPTMIGRYSEVDDFLCDVVMSSCVQVLGDAYYGDVAGEASYVLTIIYTVLRGKYDRPFKKVMQLIPGTSMDEMLTLENELASVKTLRQQRGVMMEFLAVVKVVPEGAEGEVARRILRVRKERQARWAVSRKAADQEEAVDGVLSEGGLVGLFAGAE